MVRLTNTFLAVLSMVMPLAHVLEMPNKFSLDGALWLAVQQHLYRGWGPFWGGPTEVLALLNSIVLLVWSRDVQVRQMMTIATLAYVGMLACFLFLNRPVNESVMRWTEANLPPDWPNYRLRWEVGHCVAFLFSTAGLYATVRAHVRCALRRPT
jgi:hypothetical protein